jgi:hypothetical protein
MDLLQTSRQKRILLPDLYSAFYSAYPECKETPDVERRLKSVLVELQSAGRIRFPNPRTRGAWKTGPNQLPCWVIQLQGSSKTIPAVAPDYPWLPELRQLGVSARGTCKADLARLNQFLSKHRGKLGLLPLRERSLQIFEDEKKMSKLLKNDGLYSGRLSLSVIGAFDPPLPFSFVCPRTAVEHQPILVVENHHTFSSFVTANDRFCGYTAIAYGVGNAFSKSARGLDEAVERTGASEILYFGDLDPTGILMPWRISQGRVDQDLDPIKPAIRLYEWLLEHGVRRRLPQGSRTSAAIEAAVKWLGVPMATKIEELWQSGRCIPQESLRLDLIDESCFPTPTAFNTALVHSQGSSR